MEFFIQSTNSDKEIKGYKTLSNNEKGFNMWLVHFYVNHTFV